jgi:hypothetical protein
MDQSSANHGGPPVRLSRNAKEQQCENDPSSNRANGNSTRRDSHFAISRSQRHAAIRGLYDSLVRDQTYRRVFRDRPENVCAENPRRYGTDREPAVPSADKPDF